MMPSSTINQSWRALDASGERWPEAYAAILAMQLDLSPYRAAPMGNLQLTLSGGRSSAFQLAMTIMANGGLPPNAVVTFQNTGLENPAALEFVAAFQAYFEIDIAWLERDCSQPHKVRVVDFKTASRDGRPFRELFTEVLPRRRDGTAGLRPLPNPAQRVCTAELKMKTAHRYLTRHLGWKSGYATSIGYRADEPRRVAKRRAANTKQSPEMGGTPWLPMFDAGHHAGHVLSFWRRMPFDLSVGSDFGNCELCFMKSAAKIKLTMLLRPETVPFWVEMEAIPRDRSMRFRQDRPSMQQLWDEVQRGDMSGARNDKACRSCTD